MMKRIKWRSIIALKLIIGFIAILALAACERSEESPAGASENLARRHYTIKRPKQNGKRYSELWERVRDNFNMKTARLKEQPKAHQKVQKYVQQYKHSEENLKKAGPYLYHIIEQVEKRQMPGELALLPMVESAFEPRGTSNKGAAGLWQFMPSTGRSFGLKQDKWYDGRRDVTASTKAALDYLQYLHGEFDNNWMLALAAYNAGPGTVNKAIKRNLRKGKPVGFWDLDLPRETKEYVPKLLALAELVANPQKHDMSLPPIENKPYFAPVDPGKPVDLNKVAKIAEIPVSDLKQLNPGYRQSSTHPKGPQGLLLPVEKVELVKDKINSGAEVTANPNATVAATPAKAAKKKKAPKKAVKKKAVKKAPKKAPKKAVAKKPAAKKPAAKKKSKSA